MPNQKFTADEITQSLAQLNDSALAPWQLVDDKLQKIYVFADFVQAFGFMTMAAVVAERMNHHPDWGNVYKTVRVELTTHELGGISALDFLLAAEMDKLAAVFLRD